SCSIHPTGATSPTTSAAISSPASSSVENARGLARLVPMPTKKQRRRQEKLRRHEWEEVWVDDDGQEVDAPPTTAVNATQARPDRQASAKPAARKGSSGRPRRKAP